MKKIVLTFGAISGLIISIFMLLFIHFSGAERDFKVAEIIGFAVIFLASALIFFAIKSYRDNHNGGVVSFGKAFLIGLYITLIASAIHTTGWMIYYQAGPGKEHMAEYFNSYVEEVKESDKSEEDKQKEIAELEQQREMFAANPLLVALVTFLSEVPTGGIPISLISALILMRKKSK